MQKKVLRILQEGKLAKGLSVMFPSPGIIERIGSNWDWIWIDSQHGLYSYDSILACVRACDYAETSAIVRVSGHEYGSIGVALDTGAAGVMVPMVNTRAQAEAVACAAKFPPLGHRSFGGRRAQDTHPAIRGYSATANSDTLLIAQIETQEALSNVEDIAAVPGVDVIFFSPDDIAVELGLPMDVPREPGMFQEAMQQVQTAAQKYGKMTGTVAPSIKDAHVAREIGYQLICLASDLSMMLEGSAKLLNRIESM